MKPTVVSLFCGAGGIDYGLRQAGYQTLFAIDVDRNSTETFRKIFPGSDVVNADLREYLESKPNPFPRCDVVTGGYPCQPFSMGGVRSPQTDSRSGLFLAFAGAINRIKPNIFIAENVSGLANLDGGYWFKKQINVFRNELSVRYRVTYALLNAADYGVPQLRKRVFIIGIRAGLREEFSFPNPTHCESSKSTILGLHSYKSHGDTIKDLPPEPDGEYYKLDGSQQNFSWYYLSRNRRKSWSEPSYTIVANYRHTPIHPACPVMELVWSDLQNSSKQNWKFSRKHDHLHFNPRFPKLRPRRFSWREAALIQTFPRDFEPVGSLSSKFEQIGNAVPPHLMNVIGRALRKYV